MSGYTVTISPWGRRGRRPGAPTTVEVSTDPATARVTELTVHASAGGLSPDKLPVIDYQTLVAALNPQRATPAPAPPRARTRAPRTSTAAPTRTATRAYRRMPDAREVVAVWRKGRTVMVVAEHFDVPRHTANGWLRRLRSQGAIT